MEALLIEIQEGMKLTHQLAQVFWGVFLVQKSGIESLDMGSLNLSDIHFFKVGGKELAGDLSLTLPPLRGSGTGLEPDLDSTVKLEWLIVAKLFGVVTIPLDVGDKQGGVRSIMKRSVAKGTWQVVKVYLFSILGEVHLEVARPILVDTEFHQICLSATLVPTVNLL